MTNISALAPRAASDALAQRVEQLVIHNDLSALSDTERLQYYQTVCTSLGLNWRTQPFAYLKLNGKLTLYARKDATDQLRKLYGVSIVQVERETSGDIYIVTAHAKLPDGRTDTEIGAVPLKGLSGELLANAYMKASTKAKRRVTLSICGLGFLDETETDSIPGASSVSVNHETGEILDGSARPATAQVRQLNAAPAQTVTSAHGESRRIFGRICRDMGLVSTKAIREYLDLIPTTNLDSWAESVGGWDDALEVLEQARLNRKAPAEQAMDAAAEPERCHVQDCGKPGVAYNEHGDAICSLHQDPATALDL